VAGIAAVSTDRARIGRLLITYVKALELRDGMPFAA